MPCLRLLELKAIQLWPKLLSNLFSGIAAIGMIFGGYISGTPTFWDIPVWQAFEGQRSSTRLHKGVSPHRATMATAGKHCCCNEICMGSLSLGKYCPRFFLFSGLWASVSAFSGLQKRTDGIHLFGKALYAELVASSASMLQYHGGR